MKYIIAAALANLAIHLAALATLPMIGIDSAYALAVSIPTGVLLGSVAGVLCCREATQ